MLKKTVTYEDFDGNKRTETLYFNLTRTELNKMAFELPDDVMEAVGSTTEGKEDINSINRLLAVLGASGIMDFVEKLLLKSYGIKSADGKYFRKSDEIAADFHNSMAFDAIFTEFMKDDNAAMNFVNGVIASVSTDKNVGSYIEKAQEQLKSSTSESPEN